jgi:hypothetical protein
MKYEMAGSVKLIMEQQTFASGFTKREFVLTSEEEYPQDIKFACVKDRIALLERVQPGERVKVIFRIRGNFAKDRYFVDLQPQAIERLDAGSGSVAPEAEAEAVPEPANRAAPPADEDAMPF